MTDDNLSRTLAGWEASRYHEWELSQDEPREDDDALSFDAEDREYDRWVDDQFA